MHELSIAQSILSIAEKAVPANGGVVTGISLQIGELSSIEIDALEFAFSVIKEHTALKNAELGIETMPGEAECMNCHKLFTIHKYGSPCPVCKSYALNIQKGKELKITGIIVEE